MMSSPRHTSALHRTALLTAAATFPLIFMGGLVTSHGAGMAVPDWPNSYGYNMFLFPPRLWIGGIFYEHTHRLMGTVVGMLSILLCIVAWKTEPRRWVRWLATGVLAAVTVQGVLGGLRVVLIELDLAIVHACFAQAFFCLAALMCVVTSKWWHDQHRHERATAMPIALAVAALIAIYLQLVAGAMMRHHQAGLAIHDLPLAYGKLVPILDSNELKEANWARMQAGLDLVTQEKIWLHFSHRAGAILVTAAVVMLVIRIVRRHRDQPALLRPAIVLSLLILVQLTLGVLTVLLRKPADIASAHVAVGALCLVTTFVLLVRSIRLARPRVRVEQRGFEIPTKAMATPA